MSGQHSAAPAYPLSYRDEIERGEDSRPFRSRTWPQLAKLGKAARSRSKTDARIGVCRRVSPGRHSLHTISPTTADLDSNAATPEDGRLTKFIDALKHSLTCLGGLDWHPSPEHREIINQIESQGSLGKWPARQFEEWARAPLYVLVGDRWILTAEQILLAAERRLISLPQPSEQDIDDKSKTSSLVTLLAIIQILNLTVTLAVRGRNGQAISQLEVVTAAYAVCGIATYLLQWSCPKDVGVPFLVPALRRATKEDVLLISKRGRARWWWGGMLPGKSHTISYLWTPGNSQSHDVRTLIGFVVFGALHLATWHFVFPTVAEREAWVIASLMITIVPALILVVMAFLLRLVSDWANMSDSWYGLLLFFSLWPMTLASGVFVLARVLLIVEAFRSLYFAPPGVYVDTDFGNFPGFS